MNIEGATTSCENTINKLRIHRVFSYQDALEGAAALWTTLKETPTNSDPQEQDKSQNALP